MSKTLLFAGNDMPGSPTIGGRPKSFDVQVQDIASAAHLRGVHLLKNGEIVGSAEAADLCKTIRAAHERTRRQPERNRHVAQIVSAIATKLRARGPVEVARASFRILQGYANPKERGA